MISIGTDKNLTAFADQVVGTKVIGQAAFLEHLIRILETNPITTGQAIVTLPTDAFPLVRAGVASLEGIEKQDLHILKYRGEWGLFALPSKAAPVENLSCVMYTLDAYAADPEADPEHVSLLKEENATHVLVAVLAGAGPKPPLSSKRLVRNIAGGNDLWVPKSDSLEQIQLLKKIHTEAIAATEYEKNWIVVADPEID